MLKSLFQWKERRKRDKWLINEFPRVALAQFETLCDLNPPDTPKEKLYEIMIKGFATTFGVSNENSDEFAKHILHTATLAEPSEPFGLRMVVVSLICATWSLKSELSIAVAISSVSEIIPENL